MKKKVLQLCCFSNHWDSNKYQVTSIDIKTGGDVFKLPDDYGRDFDFILSAPPCRQFTNANSRNWTIDGMPYTAIAQQCFKISLLSGRPWVLETVAGRLHKLIPDLVRYRCGFWKSATTKKQHLLFSNVMIIFNTVDQSKLYPTDLDVIMPWHESTDKRTNRETYEPAFIQFLESFI